MLRKCWLSVRPASLHRGQDFGRLVGARRLGVGCLDVSRGDENLNFDMVVRSTFESLAGRSSSSSESNACEISDLSEARVLERNSVPYLCFTKVGKSEWMSLSHVKTIMSSRLGVSSSSVLMTSPYVVGDIAIGD